MELIDTHCHLNYDYAPKTHADLIREAETAGVIAMVTIGTDMSSLTEIQKISEQYSQVYHTVGIHPHEAVTIQDADLETLEKAANHPKCRAVGEIGLDYHYDHSPRELQQSRLEQQLNLALRVKQPVVIHSREGEDDLYSLLQKYSTQVDSRITPGIIHCFSGTADFGKKCLDLGFYISFSGILTFKKADEIRAAAQMFPLDRILVETDSPYLAPIPFRGKKCEPSMVKFTAQKLAEVKSISIEEVARVTTENAKRVFRI
jgi:TatD DNase family protein